MEQTQPKPQEEPPLSTGCALIVIGLLVLVPSGLCTGYLAFGAMMGPPVWNIMPIPLLIGGPFIIGGAIALCAGAVRFVTYLRKSDGD